MPKIELSFDIDRLGQDVLKRLYAMTDEIFESEGLKCVDRGVVRVYEDRGRKKDYGRFLGGDFCAKGITRAFCEFKGMYMVQWFSKGKPDYRLPKKLVHG